MLNLALLSGDAVQAALDQFNDQKQEAAEDIVDNIKKGPEPEEGSDGEEASSSQEDTGSDEKQSLDAANEALKYYCSQAQTAFEQYTNIYNTYCKIKNSGGRLDAASAVALESLLSTDSVAVNLYSKDYQSMDASRLSMEGFASALNKAFEWFVNMIMKISQWIVSVAQKVASYLSKEGGLRGGGGGGSRTEWVEDTAVTARINEVDKEIVKNKEQLDKAKADAANSAASIELNDMYNNLLSEKEKYLTQMQSVIDAMKAENKIDLSAHAYLLVRNSKAVGFKEAALAGSDYLLNLNAVVANCYNAAGVYDSHISNSLMNAFVPSGTVDYDKYIEHVISSANETFKLYVNRNNGIYNVFRSIAQVYIHNDRQTVAVNNETGVGVDVNKHTIYPVGSHVVKLTTIDQSEKVFVDLKNHFNKSKHELDSYSKFKSAHDNVFSTLSHLNKALTGMTYSRDSQGMDARVKKDLKSHPLVSGVENVPHLIQAYNVINATVQDPNLSKANDAIVGLIDDLGKRQSSIASSIEKMKSTQERLIAGLVSKLKGIEVAHTPEQTQEISKRCVDLYIALQQTGLATFGTEGVLSGVEFAKTFVAYKNLRDALKSKVEGYTKALDLFDELNKKSQEVSDRMEKFRAKYPDMFKAA